MMIARPLLLAALALLTGCVINTKSENLRPNFETRIQYRYPGQTEANTFEGFYQKQVGQKGFRRITLELQPKTQMRILNAALYHQFFRMPDTLISRRQNDTTAAWQFLRINAGKMDKKVVWRGMLTDLPKDTLDFPGLMSYIDSTFKSLDEVQDLQ